jgi:V8-like Glu-specific endopeptidase
VEQLQKDGLLPDELGSPSDGESAGSNFAAGDTNFGTKNIYTPYSGNYWTSTWTTFPHRAIGKLLIDGGGYCTAQVISPKNIIVTAAHCVYNGGWYKGWTFVPAERNGTTPYGQFRWTRADILPGWISSGGRRNDVALIQLANNSSGRSVSYYTGWLGWKVNYPYERSLHSFGYASNISTQYTSVCAAESFYASSEGTDVLNKGCNMTYGSSGGGWIDAYRPFEAGNTNYVESVVSGPSSAGAFGKTYVGPRFSSANFGTLCGRYGGC